MILKSSPPCGLSTMWQIWPAPLGWPGTHLRSSASVAGRTALARLWEGCDPASKLHRAVWRPDVDGQWANSDPLDDLLGPGQLPSVHHTSSKSVTASSSHVTLVIARVVPPKKHINS
eukprot:2630468-Amphidinium_carterae.1